MTHRTMRRMSGELRLHIGCGSNVVDGGANLDKTWNVYLARAPRLRRARPRSDSH